MSIVKITNLHLTNFRNYKSFDLKVDSNVVFLFGDNGAGKTSIIEALSLLWPGKGLLSGDIVEQNYKPWILDKKSFEEFKLSHDVNVVHDDGNGVSSQQYLDSRGFPFDVNIVLNDAIKIDIKSHLNKTGVSKTFCVNDKNLKKHSDALNWCDVMWFSAKTQYDLNHLSYRRKFFDKLTFYCFYEHADLINDYDKLVKSRNVALENSYSNTMFLDAIEKQIAEISFKIAKNRVNSLDQINKISKNKNNDFPRMLFICSGDIEQKIMNGSDENEMVEFVMSSLKKYRERDRASGHCLFGVHKTNFDISNKDNLLFNSMSNGEQKMLFLSMINIACEVVFNIRQRSPIILLDEMMSFLDGHNFQTSINEFSKMSSQVWMTGTVSPLAYIDNVGFDIQCVHLSKPTI